MDFELLILYFNGKALPETAMLVDDWVNKSKDNREIFEHIHQSWLDAGNEDYRLPDIKAEWSAFNHYKKQLQESVSHSIHS